MEGGRASECFTIPEGSKLRSKSRISKAQLVETFVGISVLVKSLPPAGIGVDGSPKQVDFYGTG